MTLSQGLRIRPTFTVTNHFNNSEHSSCGFKSFLDFIIALVVGKLDIMQFFDKIWRKRLNYQYSMVDLNRKWWKLIENWCTRTEIDRCDDILIFFQIWCAFVFLSDLAWPWKLAYYMSMARDFYEKLKETEDFQFFFYFSRFLQNMT